jgi:glycosyltransferase involved in cell wall biosynthesis
MKSLSVVIICKNEAHIIGSTLARVQGITDDIVIVDSGSTDGTQEIVKQIGARLIETDWKGFGITKNMGVQAAKYDWILSIDADEMIDARLRQSILDEDLANENKVFSLAYRNYIGKKELRFGEWGGDKHIRLFNRKKVVWSNEPVHEQLLLPAGIEIKKIAGFVEHITMRDIAEYATKTIDYALLNADKYYRMGKKASWWKIYLSPGFTFFKNYILRLGFLDGAEGYLTARMTAFYTYLKYARLRELYEAAKK